MAAVQGRTRGTRDAHTCGSTDFLMDLRVHRLSGTRNYSKRIPPVTGAGVSSKLGLKMGPGC